MRKWHIILLFAILALGAFLRFYQITEIPPGLYPDEAMNGNNALEALQTGNFRVFYPENNGREGLFINLQAISLAVFGNEPWALRIVSALFGTLTILGVYLLAKELFLPLNQESRIKNQGGNDSSPDSYFMIHDSRMVALLAAFFVAASYWHINFSRIGFRAIMVPFFASFAMYFLLKGLRKGAIPDLVLAGLFAGLGLYTYIAFRFMIFVFAAPIVWYLWPRKKPKTQNSPPRRIPGLRPSEAKQLASDPKPKTLSCIPCAILLFVFVAFIAALPLGIYFARHPADFMNRSNEISVFAAASPIKEFGKSALSTLGMFFVKGDCNWRHNFDCRPELHPVAAVFFAVGLLGILANIIQNSKCKMQNDNSELKIIPPRRDTKIFHFALSIFNSKPNRFPALLLLAWLIAMALPAVLTREGLPHALRSIGMIPPVMILAAWEGTVVWDMLRAWLAIQRGNFPQYASELHRIQKGLALLAVLLLAVIPFMTYRAYFQRWAQHPKTYEAFAASSWHLGRFIASLPQDTAKHIVVNTKGVIVRGIPMPAQTVMFASDSFTAEKQAAKNIRYIAAADDSERRASPDRVTLSPAEKTIIAFLDGTDVALIRAFRQKYPEFKIRAPGDFVVLQNF